MSQSESDVLKDRLSFLSLYSSFALWRLAEVRHELTMLQGVSQLANRLMNWCLCSAFQAGSLYSRILKTLEKVSFLFAPSTKALKQVRASVSWNTKITSFPECAKGHYVPI